MDNPALALYCWFLLIAYVTSKGVSPSSNKSVSAVRNYDIELTSIVVTDYNADYFGPKQFIKLDSPREYSFTLDLLKDLPADVKTVYHTFERNNRNEYVPSINMRGSVCDDYAKEQHGVPMYRCMHFIDAGIKECPFKKGVYTATKVKCTSADGPVMAPGKYWRANITWVTKANLLLLKRVVEFTIINRKHGLRYPMK